MLEDVRAAVGLLFRVKGMIVEVLATQSNAGLKAGLKNN